MRHARSIWCMTSSYLKTSGFVCPHANKKPVFSKIFTLEASGELFWKDPFLVTVFIGYVWTVGQNRRKNISFETKTDISGRGGALGCIMLEAKAWLTVEMMITSLSCPWNSSTDPTFTSPNPKRSNKRRSFSTYQLNKTTKTKNRNKPSEITYKSSDQWYSLTKGG